MQTAGGYLETPFGECTDNEKKETMISDCSEMRTKGTSRPSIGLVGTARDDHLPVFIHGVMILKISKLTMAILHQNHIFGVVLATRKCNRKSQPAHRDIFLMDPHAEFEALGPRLRLSKYRRVPTRSVDREESAFSRNLTLTSVYELMSVFGLYSVV